MLAHEAILYWLNVLGNIDKWEVVNIETEDYGFSYELSLKQKDHNVYFTYYGDIREGRDLLEFLMAEKRMAFKVGANPTPPTKVPLNALGGVLSHCFSKPIGRDTLTPDRRSWGILERNRGHLDEPVNSKSTHRFFGEDLDD